MVRKVPDKHFVAIDADTAAFLDIGHHPGYVGVFTRRTTPGAIESGARVYKRILEPNDITPVGTRGTVLGSICHPTEPELGICYFVEWDDRPKHAVGVMYFKLARVLT